MINATAINAVPALEVVHVGTTQEWSLRLIVPQHGKTSPGSDFLSGIDRFTALS